MQRSGCTQRRDSEVKRSINLPLSTAQWHQWLRHTRHEPPSIQEQTFDIARRERMKELAEQADERWRSQESFLDAPRTQQPAPAIGVKDPGGYVGMTEPESKQGVRSAVEEPEKIGEAMAGEKVDEGRFRGEGKQRPQKGKKEGEAPWANQLPKGAPGEKWQPEAWTPGPAARR
jgi:NADH dehydrogenase [ubiquinone] 1 alpha subcomplex assembly factor 2